MGESVHRQALGRGSRNPPNPPAPCRAEGPRFFFKMVGASCEKQSLAQSESLSRGLRETLGAAPQLPGSPPQGEGNQGCAPPKPKLCSSDGASDHCGQGLWVGSEAQPPHPWVAYCAQADFSGPSAPTGLFASNSPLTSAGGRTQLGSWRQD